MTLNRVSSSGVDGEEELFIVFFSNFVTNFTMVSSRMFNSFLKSSLLNEPPLRAVLRSSNIFW